MMEISSKGCMTNWTVLFAKEIIQRFFLCGSLCILCGSLCNCFYYTEFHGENTEFHRGMRFCLSEKNKQIVQFVIHPQARIGKQNKDLKIE